MSSTLISYKVLIFSLNCMYSRLRNNRMAPSCVKEINI
nr:MAG TPA: hypothetical protein [Caudoviricetes sp.]